MPFPSFIKTFLALFPTVFLSLRLCVCFLYQCVSLPPLLFSFNLFLISFIDFSFFFSSFSFLTFSLSSLLSFHFYSLFFFFSYSLLFPSSSVFSPLSLSCHFYFPFCFLSFPFLLILIISFHLSYRLCIGLLSTLPFSSSFSPFHVLNYSLLFLSFPLYVSLLLTHILATSSFLLFPLFPSRPPPPPSPDPPALDLSLPALFSGLIPWGCCWKVEVQDDRKRETKERSLELYKICALASPFSAILSSTPADRLLGSYFTVLSFLVEELMLVLRASTEVTRSYSICLQLYTFTHLAFSVVGVQL